jgi:hypothetical protein
MVRLSVAVASVLLMVGFSGCNSSGGNSASNAIKSITVEDGPVLGAMVKDASGQIATQEGNSNVYTFTNPTSALVLTSSK